MTNTVRNDINRHLLESGEIDKLEAHLLSLLQETGWTEKLRETCAQRLREGQAANYGELYEGVREEAERSVADNVKQEVLTKIKKLLNGMVETQG